MGRFIPSAWSTTRHNFSANQPKSKGMHEMVARVSLPGYLMVVTGVTHLCNMYQIVLGETLRLNHTPYLLFHELARDCARAPARPPT